jgi:iron complex outermembrane receptor protein
LSNIDCGGSSHVSKAGEIIVIRKYQSIRCLAPIAAVSVMAVSASAQELEEIIVTATHREQNIQDVPLAVTALGSQDLESAGIFDATTIALNVPGMAYAEFSPGQALISIRGITSADDGAGLDNSVALFLDGIYIGRQAGITFDMFDLDRIEVLKGPQGTLFGRNAIAGAINVITSKPADEFSAKVALTVGNEGILRYQGLVTGPLSDNLSGKLVVNHREHDGFVRNTLLNKDVQDEDYTSVRGQLSLSLDSSEWLLSADAMDDDRDAMGRAPIANGNFDYVGTATTLGAGRPGTNASPSNGFTKREGSGVSLQGDIELGSGVLTSITGFRNTESDWEMESIGAPAGGGFDLSTGNFGADVIDDIEEEIDTFSQELRWTSDSGGNFDYVAGLYFFTEDTDRQEQFRIDVNTTATGQFTVGNEYTKTENETTSYAVYGHANWHFSDAWTLSVGGRFTEDDRDYRATAVNCGLTEAERAAAGFPDFPFCEGVGGSLSIIAEAFSLPASESWSDFSPVVSVQFRPGEDLMYYGTVATGYKSGGFAGSQGVAAAATNPVNPEDVINYEFGIKGDFADNTLRINASAFFMDYEDLQVVRFGPVPGSAFGTFQTTNVGSADIFGLEVDYFWQATENFSISGYYAYLDSEIKGLTLNTATGPTDFSGLPLRQSPDNSYNVIFNYGMSAGNGDYDFRLQFSHVDDQFNDYPTLTETVIEEADLLDASVRWTSAEGTYQLVLWGKNLTDERYVSHSYRIGPGSIGVWSDPLTVGVTGTVNF